MAMMLMLMMMLLMLMRMKEKIPDKGKGKRENLLSLWLPAGKWLSDLKNLGMSHMLHLAVKA